jgi:alanine racemase
MPDRITYAEIDLNSYTHNLKQLLSLLKDNVSLMAVVKANAYGHGIEKIASTALSNGASYIGVVSLGELKRLRSAKITAPVLIFNFLDSDSFDEAISLSATITVFDLGTVLGLQESAKELNEVVKVHIKIDTGMHRAGCNPSDTLKIAQSILACKNLKLEGVFTHFAESEDPDTNFTEKQLDLFKSCIADLAKHNIKPPLIHCANSAATIAWPSSHFTMVRPGIITYGLNPFSPDHPKHNYVAKKFKPILTLKSTIVFIRVIEPGETVGYNRRWIAEQKSTVALLPVGYGDGWRRTPHNAGRVSINGSFAPILGSVSMDQIVVDVTHLKNVSVGDEVILMGVDGLKADDIADSYQTINYEVVTALSDRIARNYIE